MPVTSQPVPTGSAIRPRLFLWPAVWLCVLILLVNFIYVFQSAGALVYFKGADEEGRVRNAIRYWNAGLGSPIRHTPFFHALFWIAPVDVLRPFRGEQSLDWTCSHTPFPVYSQYTRKSDLHTSGNDIFSGGVAACSLEQEVCRVGVRRSPSGGHGPRRVG